MPASETARPRAFCRTCDGLGLTAVRFLGYPTPCATCDGAGTVERTPTACYSCGLTGREWIAGLGSVRCRSCYPPKPNGVLLVEPPPADWIVLTTVTACVLLAVMLAGVSLYLGLTA